MLSVIPTEIKRMPEKAQELASCILCRTNSVQRLQNVRSDFFSVISILICSFWKFCFLSLSV